MLLGSEGSEGSEGCVASPTFVIGVASELAYENRRETVVLLGVHPLLEVGESAGVCDGLVAAEELALGILAALAWVHHTQDVILFQHHGINYLVQTGICHLTVAMLTYGIA